VELLGFHVLLGSGKSDVELLGIHVLLGSGKLGSGKSDVFKCF
jgi:hypothetical protein